MYDLQQDTYSSDSLLADTILLGCVGSESELLAIKTSPVSMRIGVVIQE